MLCVLLGTQAHSADFYSSNFEIGDFKESPLFLHKEKKGALYLCSQDEMKTFPIWARSTKMTRRRSKHKRNVLFGY